MHTYMWPDLIKEPDLTLFNFYINELIIHMCITAKGSLVCFSWGLFLRPVRCAWVLRWSLNGSGVHPPDWKSPYNQPESLAIELAGICNIKSSNGPHVKPSGSVQLLLMEKLTILWLPTTPDHPYVITCDTGVKTI